MCWEYIDHFLFLFDTFNFKFKHKLNFFFTAEENISADMPFEEIALGYENDRIS